MRLPNVFTAIADVVMGCLFGGGLQHGSGQVVCLMAASALLYTAGMILNDVFDVEVDRRERPFRPLPSSQIGVSAARAVGFAFLVLGVGLGGLAGYLPGAVGRPWIGGLVAILLALCIIGYDGWLKFTPAGPLGMGACRFLNVLLGMSASRPSWSDIVVGYSGAELLAATGVGTYIVGVTWFARSEAGRSNRAPLLAAIGVMSVGVVFVGLSVGQREPLGIGSSAPLVYPYYCLLLALLMFSVLRRCFVAALDPGPEKVQAAVKHSILSLIWLDAATALAVAGPAYGVAVAALLIPALLLGRWVYST
jgi:4-hydroxybenzoate polyprenyltransferase